MNKYNFVFMAFMCATSGFTQPLGSWQVGQSVNAGLNSDDLSSTGCYPNPDYSILVPTSIVTGVNYIFKVISANPSGTITLYPGPTGPLSTGSTYVLDDIGGAYSVYMAEPASQLIFQILALGTPTMAFQQHPCGQQFFPWVGVGSCPQNRSTSAFNNNGCYTYIVNGITEDLLGPIEFSLPSANNNFELTVLDPSIRVVNVFDTEGRLVTSASYPGTPISFAGIRTGVYVAQAATIDGKLLAKRFALVH